MLDNGHRWLERAHASTDYPSWRVIFLFNFFSCPPFDLRVETDVNLTLIVEKIEKTFNTLKETAIKNPHLFILF